MVTVPAVMPPTTPATGSTVPIAVLLLDQIPPGVGSVKVQVEPEHMVVVPTIGPGVGQTVTVKNAYPVQPQPLVME